MKRKPLQILAAAAVLLVLSWTALARPAERTTLPATPARSATPTASALHLLPSATPLHTSTWTPAPTPTLTQMPTEIPSLTPTHTSSPQPLPTTQPPTDTSASIVMVFPTARPGKPDRPEPTDTPLPAPAQPSSPLPVPTSLPTLTPRPTCTPASSPTPTPSDPAAWWTWPCNVRCPPAPDGCSEFARWDRPPDNPITPPCIRTAYTDTVPNDDVPDILDLRVVIILDHPEDPHYTYPDHFATQTVYVTRYLGDQWYTDEGPNWGYDCNLNPAPLAWAVTEALNTGSIAPFDVAYNAPLPDPFVGLLGNLIANPPTPMPTPTLKPTAAPTITPTAPTQSTSPVPTSEPTQDGSQ
jgi:hypothetical protein